MGWMKKDMKEKGVKKWQMIVQNRSAWPQIILEPGQEVDDDDWNIRIIT